jgi:hypothetical protein
MSVAASMGLWSSLETAIKPRLTVDAAPPNPPASVVSSPAVGGDDGLAHAVTDSARSESRSRRRGPSPPVGAAK